MNFSHLRAFTLVELIVVIAIVGILSTIGFVSYSNYLSGARDSNRVSQLTKLSDSLQVYSARKSLPLPDDYIDITASGTLVGYQGYIGVDVLETIDYTNGGIDPKDKGYYTYYLTKNRKSMQLLALMEENSILGHSPELGQAHAGIYPNRYPKVYGRKLGVLTELNTNTPAQEVSGATSLDLVNTTSQYVVHISNEEKIQGTGATILVSNPRASCKRIRQTGESRGNGFYNINFIGNDISVYCDMETDGGGWTAITRFNPSLNNSLYWNNNAGTKNSQGFYNYLNLSKKFVVNEIYVSKTQGWDGSEYVFQKVGNDLYARRGVLKDIAINSNWQGLGLNFNNWIGFNYSTSGFTSNGIVYYYLGHNNVSPPFYDFPFYYNTGTANLENEALTNSTWGGRDNNENYITSIYIR